MWRKNGYVEISAHKSVRDFLDQSTAYRNLIHIPFVKLNKAHQEIFKALCDPASFTDLEAELQKMTPTGADTKSSLGLYLGSLFDVNDNFKYYLTRLKEEYEALRSKNEKTPLIQ